MFLRGFAPSKQALCINTFHHASRGQLSLAKREEKSHLLDWRPCVALIALWTLTPSLPITPASSVSRKVIRTELLDVTKAPSRATGKAFHSTVGRGEHCLPSFPPHLPLCYARVLCKVFLSQCLEKSPSAPASGSSYSPASLSCPLHQLSSSTQPLNSSVSQCSLHAILIFLDAPLISSETSYVLLISNNCP